jgi:heat shock protein HslJ
MGKRSQAFTFSILVVCVVALQATTAPVAAICLHRPQTRGERGAFGAAQLENTDWKLVELDGKPVAAPSGQREPHLRLNSEEKTLTGFGGCNSMRGAYQLDGDRLKFTQIASTRRFCSDSPEGAFFKALNATDSFRLSGDKLELLGGGKSLAKFEAAK